MLCTPRFEFDVGSDAKERVKPRGVCRAGSCEDTTRIPDARFRKGTRKGNQMKRTGLITRFHR